MQDYNSFRCSFVLLDPAPADPSAKAALAEPHGMHELGITQSIVEIVTEKAQGAKVLSIVLEIGKLSGVLPDAVQFCFDVCSRGTSAQGARLDIVEIPGLARCLACGCEVPLDLPFGRCSCGSWELLRVSGEELRIREMEVA
jgi:hydrogenase nickel incorporation protein HypA/HybF